MEQYAQTGQVDDPTFKAKKPEAPKLAEWDPRYKEQQEREKREADKAAAAKAKAKRVR